MISLSFYEKCKKMKENYENLKKIIENRRLNGSNLFLLKVFKKSY